MPQPICFILPGATPAFYPDSRQGVFGGSEFRAYQLATGLAKGEGWSVKFLTGGGMALPDKEQEGVQVKHVPSSPGWQDRMLIKLQWKGDYEAWHREQWRRAISGADAALYLVFGVSPRTLQELTLVHEEGKTGILMLAHDEDVSEHYYEGSREQNRHGARGDLCYQALMAADHIVAQTEKQQTLLKERFDRESALLRNPIELPSEVPPEEKRAHVLWVGRSNATKRPEPFLELAKQHPDHPMIMVMNPVDRELHERIREGCPENLTILDYVPPERIEELFERAWLFVSTSVSEGFPNTFLQAAKYHVPVLSLEADPDGLLTDKECGVCARGDLEGFRYAYEDLAQNEEKRQELSERFYEHVRQEHDRGKVVKALEEILQSVREEKAPTSS